MRVGRERGRLRAQEDRAGTEDKESGRCSRILCSRARPEKCCNVKRTRRSKARLRRWRSVLLRRSTSSKATGNTQVEEFESRWGEQQAKEVAQQAGWELP